VQLTGLHHVTAITARAEQNLDFYTQVLGLRLVKKTVNQDDVSAYHLFYADKFGSPGTDLTFFDWPNTPPNQNGAGSIARVMLRAPGPDALRFWEERLTRAGVPHSGLLTGSGPATVMLVERSEAGDFEREMDGCTLMRASINNGRSIE